jgi:hypothetical protein
MQIVDASSADIIISQAPHIERWRNIRVVIVVVFRHTLRDKRKLRTIQLATDFADRHRSEIGNHLEDSLSFHNL